MSRSVFLGTKPVEGSVASRLATHWAVAVGEGGSLLWLEIDGNSGVEQEQDDGSKNTINGFDQSWWSMKTPLPILSRGSRARSGAGVVKELGNTERTDEEIFQFNATYLEQHPCYSLARKNCQDYVNALVKWMLGSTKTLPMREMPKYGLRALGAGLAIAGALWVSGRKKAIEVDNAEKKVEEKEVEERELEEKEVEEKKVEEKRVEEKEDTNICTFKG